MTFKSERTFPPTWAEHLAWCKTRALQYVEAGDPEQAIASMSSDLRKHPDAPGPGILAHLTFSALLGPKDKTTIRRWIEGFN